MSNRTQCWMLCMCLVAGVMLALSGNATAFNPAELYGGISASLGQTGYALHSPLAPAAIGMSDLMSQTFEFTGAFPAGWQTYSAISQTVGTMTMGDYSWSTTAYTKAEGVRSAIAMLGGLSGAILTDTAVYTAPVDSWLVYGPVSLTAVWQARLDFQYLFTTPLTSSARLTVAISTDYDPISRTGTFAGQVVTPTDSWTAGTLDLSAHSGQSVYVAFHYQSSEGGQVSSGPFVDDVHLRVSYRVMLPIIRNWTLNLSKSASASIVQPGQPIVYSIRVGNTGAVAATSVTLSDTVPVSTTFASADGGGIYDALSRTVTWLDLTVPAGGNIVRYMTVTVPSAGYANAVVNRDYAVSVPSDPTILYGPPVTTSVVSTFFDDFSDPTSGWPIQSWTGDIVCWPPPGSTRSGYLSGGAGYGINVGCAWNGQVFPAPARIADIADFTVDADLRSNQDYLWYSSYGLFFNGSEDLRQIYTIRLYQGQDPPEFDVIYWPTFLGSSDDPGKVTFSYARCWSCNGVDGAWNHVLVRRLGTVFEVWMGSGQGVSNLARMGVFNYSASVDNDHRRVGVYQGNFEWRGDSGPSYYAYVFDSFRLTPAVR